MIRSHFPAANTDAVCTIPSSSTRAPILNRIDCAYSGTLISGSIKITVDGVILWQLPITAIGPNSFKDLNISGKVGSTMVITLVAGGASATGWLNVTAEGEN